MTNYSEARPHVDYVNTRMDSCRDEERKTTKKEVKVDPGFLKAIEGFVKKRKK